MGGLGGSYLDPRGGYVAATWDTKKGLRGGYLDTEGVTRWLPGNYKGITRRLPGHQGVGLKGSYLGQSKGITRRLPWHHMGLQGGYLDTRGRGLQGKAAT